MVNATEGLRRLESLGERRPGTIVLRAMWHQLDGRGDAAVLCLEKIDVTQLTVGLARQAGNLAYELKSWTLAMSFYDRALQQLPDDGSIRNSLGLCCQQMGEFKQAIEHHGMAVTLSHDLAATYQWLSEALEGAGRTLDAHRVRESARRFKRNRLVVTKDGVSLRAGEGVKK